MTSEYLNRPIRSVEEVLKQREKARKEKKEKASTQTTAVRQSVNHHQMVKWQRELKR